MDKKMITGMMLLIAILLIVFVILVGNSLVEGKRVTISGTVSNNIVTGWGITADEYKITDDHLFEIGLWYMPWDTKDILVVAVLQDQEAGMEYMGEAWIGTANVVYSNKYFDVVVHYLPEGQYDGTLYVYEVNKGFIGLFEESRELKATVTTGVIIVQ